MRSLENYESAIKCVESTYLREWLRLVTGASIGPTMWAKYRRAAGIVGSIQPTGKRPPSRSRMLTPRQAVLVTIAALWTTTIKKDLGSTLKLAKLNEDVLADVTGEWLAKTNGAVCDVVLRNIESAQTSIDGGKAQELLSGAREDLGGKPLTEVTIRKWCRELNHQFSRNQVIPSSVLRGLIKRAIGPLLKQGF
jgi:hypothetical protein